MEKAVQLAKQIRMHALNMVHDGKASHIGSALSIADILAVLYNSILRHDSTKPDWAQRDRFILSKGHACVAVYAVLAECGYFPKEQLKTYGNDHSWLMNHISHKVKGVEFSTGSLGHGLPYGVGKALAAKSKQENWNVYVLLSDGELDEGSNWEALMFAAHHRLTNLTVIIDYNKLQSLDTVSNTLTLEPLAQKLKAFGCDVKEVDGHNHKILSTILRVRNDTKPTVVIAHTTKGKGVSFMENSVEWHYKSPDADQLARAKAEIETRDA